MNKGLVFLAAFGGAILGALFTLFAARWVATQSGPDYDSFEKRQNSASGWYSDAAKLSGKAAPTGLNFVSAANSVRASVVHIKTSYKPNALLNSYDGSDAFEDFFSDRFHDKMENLPREASGSGVIISDDGYIVTNNHVISDATEITVILNDKRRYKGRLVGADPTTDLALVKIEGNDLPFAQYGNSDSLQIGEWVLAVGNPFELTSTVTAGIVSAKARSINILGSRGNGMAVESFIQTDAAVNPGNSGGALVDLQGRLIGINTAIASNTGTFSGYSFAVPVTLVKKVMDDLLRYGEVQRALLGVNIKDVDADLADAKGIPDTRGVYVQGVNPGSAAGQAGIKAGDVILEVDKVPVNSTSALQEYVARFRPGDKVRVTFERGRDVKSVQITLRNTEGMDKVAKAGPRKTVYAQQLGVKLRSIGTEQKSQLGLDNGVEIVGLDEESAFANAGVRESFIITSIDKKVTAKPEDIILMTAGAKGGLLIEGFYPDGRRAYYAIGF
jgi:Do/DeqQ family serine protease